MRFVPPLPLPSPPSRPNSRAPLPTPCTATVIHDSLSPPRPRRPRVTGSAGDCCVLGIHLAGRDAVIFVRRAGGYRPTPLFFPPHPQHTAAWAYDERRCQHGWGLDKAVQQVRPFFRADSLPRRATPKQLAFWPGPYRNHLAGPSPHLDASDAAGHTRWCPRCLEKQARPAGGKEIPRS